MLLMYGLSDEGLADALYDSIALRAFAGIDFAVENVPQTDTEIVRRDWHLPVCRLSITMAARVASRDHVTPG
jgi:hypothetical protein